MKRFFKQTIAILLMIVMAAFAFGGCSKKNAGGKSMFQMAGNAIKTEKADYSTKITAKISGVTVKGEIYGSIDGNNRSMSAKVSFGGMAFTLENILIMNEDAIYLNVKEIMDQVKSYLSLVGISEADVDNMGITMDWLKFEVKGAFKKDTTLTDNYVNDADSAYKDIVTKEGNTYVLDLSTVEKQNKFIKATADMITVNADKWADAYMQAYNKVDATEIFENLFDQIKDALKGTNFEITDEMYQELLNSIKNKTNTDAVALDKDTIKKSLTEAAEELTKLSEKNTELNANVKITTKYENKAYTTTVEAKDSKDNKVTIESTITPNNKASVTVPSNATPIFEIIKPLLENFGDRIPSYGLGDLGNLGDLGDLSDMGDLSDLSDLNELGDLSGLLDSYFNGYED